MAPNPRGQYQVLLDAYSDANVMPSEVNYLEVHGTGTTIGDPIEVNVLSKLFSKYHKNGDNEVGIGSVKTNIGHLLSAAGGAGLAKILLCLKNKQFVPSLHLETLNPALKLEKSPFYVVREIEPWSIKHNKTRKVGLSSFGLGGTNAHIVLEEWPDDLKINNQQTLYLLTLSAKSQKALEKIINQTKAMLENSSDLNITNLCFTRNRYRKHYTYRAALLVSSAKKIKTIFKAKETNLKKKSVSVGIIIGDLIKERREFSFERKDLNMLMHEIGNIDFKRFNKNELIFFYYWYSVLKNLKQNTKDISVINGMKSGEVIADLLNEKIDLTKAIELYFSKKSISANEDSSNNCKYKVADLKCDILINLNNSKEKLLPPDANEKVKIINLKNGINDTFNQQLLSLMGELYVSGVTFDWDRIHPHGSGKLMTLPPYPFAQKSFWINSAKENY